VIRNYAELPPVLCYPDELNQVWTNLVHNALQAMDYRGTLTIGVTQVTSKLRLALPIAALGYQKKLNRKYLSHSLPQNLQERAVDWDSILSKKSLKSIPVTSQ
jgi:nitrogen-specific signal transduction histidine kinase